MHWEGELINWFISWLVYWLIVCLYTDLELEGSTFDVPKESEASMYDEWLWLYAYEWNRKWTSPIPFFYDDCFLCIKMKWTSWFFFASSRAEVGWTSSRISYIYSGPPWAWNWIPLLGISVFEKQRCVTLDRCSSFFFRWGRKRERINKCNGATFDRYSF